MSYGVKVGLQKLEAVGYQVVKTVFGHFFEKIGTGSHFDKGNRCC